MKPGIKARSWHTWASILLAVPILIVGATAVFIAHKKALGTEEIRVDAKWLPGYRAAAFKAAKAEPRAVLVTLQGETLIGTQDGLFRLEGANPVVVDVFAGTPVRALVESGFGRVAAARNGIWLENAGRWEQVKRGDAWNASVRADGSVVVAMKDVELLVSGDGRTWAPDPLLSEVLAAIGERMNDKPLTLNKLVMDLHTGQAFFGKAAEWIWIDAIGIAMCLLALTGVYMWWRAERRKAAVARG